MKIFIFFLFLAAQGAAETIGVMGSGYVGLVLSGMLAKSGHQVICVDIDREKIARLNQGILPIFEPGLKELLSKDVSFTDDIQTLQKASILFVCVGTPPDPSGRCDCSALYQALDWISRLDFGEKPVTVCIKSTISPGTFEKLEAALGNDSEIRLVYNPEFMREGSAISDLESKNPIVLGARSPEKATFVKELYASFLQDHPEIELIETTPETAELIKYGWNGFSAIRIAYINELSQLCSHFSADVDTLVRAIAWSERLLPTENLKPGCGYGGSCLPKDSLGLSRIFEQIGLPSTLVHQAITSNQQHIETIVEKLHQFAGKAPKRITILGLAFKANTDDIRKAPSIAIIRALLDRGYAVQAFDPHALPRVRDLFPEISGYNCPYEAAQGSDCVLILTDCMENRKLDLNRLSSLVAERKIADLKNLFSPNKLQEYGFQSINLGRQL